MLDPDRLTDYALAFGSKAVIRRVGFFMDYDFLALRSSRRTSDASRRCRSRRAATAPAAPCQLALAVYEDPSIVGPARSLK